VIWDKASERLKSGESILGSFGLSGSEESLPGLLRWSPDSGAMIELNEPAKWPVQVGSEHLTIHGVIEDSNAITLLDSVIRTTTFDDQTKRIGSYTLVLGEHIESNTTWDRAIYSTTHLPEWRGITGLTHSVKDAPRKRLRYSVDWKPPAVQEASVRGALLRFVTDIDREVGQMPAYSLTSRQRVVARPRRPMRIEAFSQRYAMPLLALTAFAADRPDSIVEEIYSHGKRRQRIEVWRAGERIQAPEWRRNRLLFRAEDLADFRLSIVRWWRLYEKVRPALGIFGDHLNEGSTFSRPRLITLHTAICAYTDARHGHRDPRKLRTFAEVPNEVTGCSNDALALFGAARDYFAHLGSPGQRFTIDEIESGTVLATRRASALMQASLLRELGFSSKRATELLEGHYRDWPL
jgi:hypothetical protein